MAKAYGTYKAQRDDQTYAYDVTWDGVGQSIVWDAKVRLNGELVALPSGIFRFQGRHPTKAVTQEVESAIEHRLIAVAT